MPHVIDLQFLLKLQTMRHTTFHGHRLPIFSADLSADSPKWPKRIYRTADQARARPFSTLSCAPKNQRARDLAKNKRGRPASGFFLRYLILGSFFSLVPIGAESN